jgi:hypothetical protein
MSRASQSTVLCTDCLFFLDARQRHRQRCLHPHSRLHVHTAVARYQFYRRPQERNPTNTCGDFRPWRWWERCLQVDPKLVFVGLVLSLVCVLVVCHLKGAFYVSS